MQDSRENSGSTAWVAVQKSLLPRFEAIRPYLEQVDTNRWYSNRGPLVWDFEQRLSQIMGCSNHAAIACSSGTSALESAILGHAGQADPARPIALVPSYTFVATAHAAVRCGYQVHFVDVDPDTWMLDPARILQHHMLPKTGVLLPVAAFGRRPDLEKWGAVQSKTDIPVVVDAAAAFEHFITPHPLVSAEVPAVLSFHATKAFTSAEGGAVLSRDTDLLRRVAQIANFGMNDKRVCELPGLNSKMSEYHAAVGLACLDSWQERTARYRALASQWQDATSDWPGRVFTTPDISAAYVAWEAPDVETSAAVEAALERARIDTRRWYGMGLHRQPQFADAHADTMTVTETLGARHLGLPAAIDLTRETIDMIAEVALSAMMPISDLGAKRGRVPV